MTQNEYPWSSIPSDSHAAKLLGLYPQCQEGLWLQRVKVPGGVLSGSQWRALGAIAREFSPRTPLHLTTRQDIEIHDLAPDQVPPAQRALSRVGLSCFGAAGDTVRNITVCPCSGVEAGSVDLHPVAARIAETLQEIEGIYSLPRKFKIGLACGEECDQPWINDLGLIVRRAEGVAGFRVIAGGSLGPRPGAGLSLFDSLPAADLLPLVVAVIRVFAAHGDRTVRSKARLRHIRERVGDEAFQILIRAAFEEARRERSWPDAVPTPPQQPFTAKAWLTFANGDVTPEMADELGGLADLDRLRVRIANDHRAVVFGKNAEILAHALAGAKALEDARRLSITVVSCPGKRWCSRAVVHTKPLADRIRTELGGRLPAGSTVCISGCPNGCSRSTVADIGLVGTAAAHNGERCDGFDLYLGGGMGRSAKIAARVAQRLTTDEAFTAVARALGAPDGARVGGTI